MSEGPTPEHPMLFFTPTRGGYRVALDADRSVQLSLGQDDAGVTRWSLRTENCGHVITFCLSDEAMDAILRMYCGLLVDAMARDEESAGECPRS